MRRVLSTWCSMKERISITVEKETVSLLDKLLKKNKRYRNRSHLIEEAIGDFNEKENKSK